MDSRSSWGARRTSPPKDNTPKRVMVIHHSAGAGQAIDTLSEQRAAMRAIQRFHMDTNGWQDIGYLGVVFQPYGRLSRARAFVGRGWDQDTHSIVRALPAAQTGANSGTIPICVVGNFEHEQLRRATRGRLVEIAKHVKREHGVTHLCGHRDFGGTACPGDNLYRWLPYIAGHAGLKLGRP